MNVVGMVHDAPRPTGQAAESVQVRLYSSLFPTTAETDHGLYSLATPVSLRITARQVRLRYEELTAGDWRVGTPRLDLTVGSRR